ncbi:hypothetical protein HUA76_34620 [Myxococcus sp. CA056]|uniref:hypothetical protein n=1 Tax=Myxococcus sp. CA056 TaxID=2741740 RepID=UPI00157B78F8|nr:hypothetical protein [Myxococcus sp. CA056]NTX15915.1 hypothetical protein [Myxococcus sp. CA056]
MSVEAPRASRAPPWFRARRGRWRLLLGWGLVLVLALEGLLNLVLNVGLVPAQLARATPRTRVEWRGGWWLWPRPVHLRGFSVWQRDARAEWRIDAETVEAHASLFALLSRRVHAQGVRARGVSVHAEPMPAMETTPTRRRHSHPWEIELRDIELEDLHELTLKPVRYVGPGQAKGSVRLVTGQRLTVTLDTLHLEDGALEQEGRTVARVREVSGVLDLDAIRAAPEEPRRVAKFDGRLGVRLEILDLAWLGALVSREHPDLLREGAGQLDAEVRIQGGHLAAGSRVDASGAPLELRVGPVRARAPWSVHGEVTEDGGTGAHSVLKMRFAPVHVEGKAGRVLEIPEVSLTLRAKTDAPDAKPQVKHELRVMRSRPVDLRMLNAWMGKTFHVESGHATLEASDSTSGHEDSQRLRLDLSSNLVEGRWAGILMLGKASAEIDARRLRLHGKSLGLDGSALHLNHVSADVPHITIRGWSGRFDLPHARLTLEPVELEAHFSAHFSNADPFVALLTAEKKLPGFLSPLLEARDLRVTGQARMSDAGFQVRALHAKADGLELEGRLDTARGTTHALIYAKVGILSGAIEVKPGDTHVQLKDARRWYEERLPTPSD